MLFIIIVFFIASVAGWLLDSAYSSLSARRLISSGFFRGYPICPIYGFGVLMVIYSFKFFAINSPIVIIYLTTFLVIVLEYFGGWFSKNILGVILWDYSSHRFNLHGHISLWHSFLWFVSVTIFYFMFVLGLGNYLDQQKIRFQLTPLWDTIFLLSLLLAGLLATLHQQKLYKRKIA